MEIKFTLSDEEFTKADQEAIRNALSLVEEDLVPSMNKIAKASIMEYIKMFTDKGLPRRIDEVLQDRLYFLINYYYMKKLPIESEIAEIFHLTYAQSKILLRNVRSRYKTKIKEQVYESLREIIKKAAKNEKRYKMFISSANILEELDSVINQKGQGLEKILPIKGSACEYSCSEDTFKLIERTIGKE